MIRVLIIDDSFFVRKVIRTMLSIDGEIEIIGEAANANEGLEKIAGLHPDVICLDIVMPNRDGVSTLEEIIRKYPTPVILFSSLAAPFAEISQRAFDLGVIDVVQKPDSPEKYGTIRDILIAKIQLAAKTTPERLKAACAAALKGKATENSSKAADKLLVIASPSSKPIPLENLLNALPAPCPASVVIHINIQPQLTNFWMKHIRLATSFDVKIAQDGDILLPGRILFPPHNKILEINRLQKGGVVQVVNYENASNSYIDTLFASAGRAFRKNVTAVILTGMGTDGIEGLRQVKEYEGTTFIEKDGLPHPPTLKANYVDHILPVFDIGLEIAKRLIK
jgi:two-component system chemotaxis response regulator CheB